MYLEEETSPSLEQGCEIDKVEPFRMHNASRASTQLHPRNAQKSPAWSSKQRCMLGHFQKRETESRPRASLLPISESADKIDVLN